MDVNFLFVFFFFIRNIRGSSNAHNTNDNLFLTIIRPVMVELVEN
jgi:hypothetical protein